jgi:prevent-host-death family protein
MRTTTIELDEFRAHLDQALAETERGDVILTREGKPWIVLRSVSHDLDEEDNALAYSREFWDLIRERRSEPAISWEDAKGKLDGD